MCSGGRVWGGGSDSTLEVKNKVWVQERGSQGSGCARGAGVDDREGSWHTAHVPLQASMEGLAGCQQWALGM